MAVAAGFAQVFGVDPGLRVIGRQDVVRAVAACAVGRAFVAESLGDAVEAGLVGRLAVGPASGSASSRARLVACAAGLGHVS